MTLKEKKCPYCNQFFFYEDEIDSHGLILSRNDSRARDDEKIRSSGYCPRCVDPNRISGMTYRKSSILKQLQSDDLELLKKDYPLAYKIYTETSYHTFTIFPDTIIKGKYGNFRIGILVQRGSIIVREIFCIRCKKKSFNSIGNVLRYYLGFSLKQCQKCDAKEYVSKHKRNTKKLKRGSVVSPYSDLSKARALNVSLNDYRRYSITKPFVPLPLGSEVNGLVIKEAFWDNKTYCPKYLLICEKCSGQFIVSQKSVQLLEHQCGD